MAYNPLPPLGQAAMAGSLPVVIASNQTAVPSSQSGTWNINNVSGTVSLPTNAAQETGGNLATLAGGVSGGKYQVALQAETTKVIGAVNQGTSPWVISGTVTANAGTNLNTSLLALESGGNLAAIATDTADIEAAQISGAQKTQIVDGSGNVIGSTSNALNINISSGNITGFALDTSVNGILLSQASTTSGQKGALVQGAVTTSAPSYSNNQTNPLSLDTNGNLRVVTSSTSTIGTVNQGTNPWTDNISQWGGTNVVNGGVAGLVGVGGNVTTNNTITANPILIGGSDYGGTAKIQNWKVDSSGNGQVNITQFGGGAVSTVATGIPKVGVTDSAGSPVTSNSTTYSSKIALDSNLLGTLGTAFSTAGKVDALLFPGTSGGLSYSAGAAVINSAAAIKGSAGQVYGYVVYNPNNVVAFLQFYNSTTGNTSVGTAVQWWVPVPPGATANLSSTMGINFTTAITVAACTTATGSTALGTGLSVVVFSK